MRVCVGRKEDGAGRVLYVGGGAACSTSAVGNLRLLRRDSTPAPALLGTTVGTVNSDSRRLEISQNFSKLLLCWLWHLSNLRRAPCFHASENIHGNKVFIAPGFGLHSADSRAFLCNRSCHPSEITTAQPQPSKESLAARTPPLRKAGLFNLQPATPCLGLVDSQAGGWSRECDPDVLPQQNAEIGRSVKAIVPPFLAQLIDSLDHVLASWVWDAG